MKHIKKIEVQAPSKSGEKAAQAKAGANTSRTSKEEVLLASLRTYMCNPNRV